VRFPHRPAAAFAALGVTLAALAFSLSVAAASKPAAPSPVTFHQVVPGIAGDSASGFGELATVTPTTASGTPTPPTSSCTSGHTSLRAFTDPGAAALNRDPQPATIPFFNILARPAAIPTDATRTAPLETTFYTVSANLVSLGIGANGAWDIVLDSGGGMTMHVSFPAQSCLTGLPAADQGAINGARTTFRTACGEPPASGSRALRGGATITGPGYWGSKALENASTSGAEIGPIFAFSFTDSGSCDPRTQPTPTPVPTPLALQFIRVGSDHDGITGYHPGDVVTATAYLTPAVAGVSCQAQYTNPGSGGQIGTVISDPGLITKMSGADGTVNWQFRIPADSPPGSPPTGGRFEVHCLQGSIQVEAVESITIHVP
jgi:hypothetical protein